MIRLLSALWSGCWHKWKIIDERVVDYDFEFSRGVAMRYTLQCEHCGNVKAKLAK